MLKTFTITTRVSAKERDMFEKLATEEHKTIAQLIRECLYSRLEAKKKGIAA